jgi:hydrogenase maturation protease
LKTIILGLGNPIFCDDAVGLLVARAAGTNISGTDITIAEATAAGIDILDIISGYEKALIIDAIQTDRNNPGTVLRIELKQYPEYAEPCAHNISFLSSIMLGKQMGLPLPKEIIIFGIEVENIQDLGEGCTPAVKAAIPNCVDMILDELNLANSAQKTGVI